MEESKEQKLLYVEEAIKYWLKRIGFFDDDFDKMIITVNRTIIKQSKNELDCCIDLVFGGYTEYIKDEQGNKGISELKHLRNCINRISCNTKETINWCINIIDEYMKGERYD